MADISRNPGRCPELLRNDGPSGLPAWGQPRLCVYQCAKSNLRAVSNHLLLKSGPRALLAISFTCFLARSNIVFLISPYLPLAPQPAQVTMSASFGVSGISNFFPPQRVQWNSRLSPLIFIRSPKIGYYPRQLDAKSVSPSAESHHRTGLKTASVCEPFRIKDAADESLGSLVTSHVPYCNGIANFIARQDKMSPNYVSQSRIDSPDFPGQLPCQNFRVFPSSSSTQHSLKNGLGILPWVPALEERIKIPKKPVGGDCRRRIRSEYLKTLNIA